jgi:hypothetical protein
MRSADKSSVGSQISRSGRGILTNGRLGDLIVSGNEDPTSHDQQGDPEILMLYDIRFMRLIAMTSFLRVYLGIISDLFPSISF